MTRVNCKLLDTGDVFPSLEIAAVDGGVIKLPEDVKGQWAVLLVYRGHW